MLNKSNKAQEIVPSEKTKVSSNQDKEIDENKKPIKSELHQEEDTSSATSVNTRQQVSQAFMGMIQSQMRSTMGVLFDKFTEKHIDKYLDYIQRDDDHEYELRKTNRLYYLIYFIIVVITVSAAVIYLLPRDKTFLELIINILVILGGGIGTGYGLSKRKEK